MTGNHDMIQTVSFVIRFTPDIPGKKQAGYLSVCVFVLCPHMTAHSHPAFRVMKVVVITVIISLHKYVLKNDPDKLDSDSF